MFGFMLNPVEFTPATLPNGETGVQARIHRLLAGLLVELVELDPNTLPTPTATAGATLASVPGDDMFAQLEAEMVTDRIAASLAERRTETRDRVAALLTADRTPDGRVEQVLEVEEVQALLEWGNHMYVMLRTGELAAHGVTAEVGLEQSTAALLGLDDADALTGDAGEDADRVSMELPTLMLAGMVEEIHQVLEVLDANPAT